MKYLNLVPACHDHLKNHPKRLQILMSLAEQGCKERYPDTAISRDQMLAVFQGAGIIKDRTALEAEETLSVDCYSIVSEYKCSYICPVCPLSGRYKNALESEEGILLSYALASPEHFFLLKESGVTSKLFQSLFLVNPVPTGTLVATLPLNRLAYFYLECTTDTLASFSSLPADITAAIERDNKKKLTRHNTSAIHIYLKQLQQSYHAGSEGAISRILKDNFGLTPALMLSKEGVQESHPPEAPARKPSADGGLPPLPDSGCLEGLLIPSVKTASSEVKPSALQEPALYMKKEPAGTEWVRQKPAAPISARKGPLFLPLSFSMEDNGGYPVILLSMSSAMDRKLFQDFLLNHPKVALEVITESATGAECLLFFGSQTFYLIRCNDMGAPDVLRHFLGKSPVRNQLCLDPYRLYCYLAKHNLTCQNVFSLRAAYTALTRIQNRSHLKTLYEMIKELVSHTNVHALPTHIFCMPYYCKMQEVMAQNHVFQQEDARKLFTEISAINTLLGISYDLQESVAAPPDSTLFELDENLDYKFHYQNESMHMKPGLYSVTYTIAVSQPECNIAMDVLYQFAKKELLLKFSYRLLTFRHDSFTFSTTEEDYAHLCEIVANMATHIAACKGQLPVHITEEKNPL